MKKLLIAIWIFSLFIACKENNPTIKDVVENPVILTDTVKKEKPFFWESANIYFLLTDRFSNGNLDKDINFSRTDSTATLRGFEGGDILGITKKIEEGYFSDLGINVIWLSPITEQIHGSTNEGTGNSYGYHGYWTKDWTAIDPNFGTREDLHKLVKTAHEKDIRIVLDVVLNHTGPVTDIDPAWPKDWVQTDSICKFTSYKNTTACSLSENLPDILTVSDEPVKLPDALLAKWKEENRLSQELDELNLFFLRTGYPRAPRFYIIKWLTDYINEYGIDGFRVDTANHVNENVWLELRKEADYAFENWKKKHANEVLDDKPFYMAGEVNNYGISSERLYDFGDKKVDYFNHGFSSLINYELKVDAKKDYEFIFKKYNHLLNNKLYGKSVVNYLTSHDDVNSFDKQRTKPFYSANVLLLTPGASQIYYGDETARPLIIKGTKGDASLRSFMNWEDLDSISTTQKIHKHWQKLGQFRAKHPAVGAGKHRRLAKSPYIFSRMYENGEYKDKVVIALDLPKGKKSLWVKSFFGEETILYDTYSQTEVVVKNGKVLLENDFNTALLEIKE